MLFLFFAARRFLECLGQARPTLVVFEDIHWAQPSELQLLEYLNAQVRDSAVLFLSLARPEFVDLHPTWGGGLTAQTTIPLEPLPPPTRPSWHPNCCTLQWAELSVSISSSTSRRATPSSSKSWRLRLSRARDASSSQ